MNNYKNLQSLVNNKIKKMAAGFLLKNASIIPKAIQCWWIILETHIFLLQRINNQSMSKRNNFGISWSLYAMINKTGSLKCQLWRHKNQNHVELCSKQIEISLLRSALFHAYSSFSCVYRFATFHAYI